MNSIKEYNRSFSDANKPPLCWFCDTPVKMNASGRDFCFCCEKHRNETHLVFTLKYRGPRHWNPLCNAPDCEKNANHQRNCGNYSLTCGEHERKCKNGECTLDPKKLEVSHGEYPKCLTSQIQK